MNQIFSHTPRLVLTGLLTLNLLGCDDGGSPYGNSLGIDAKSYCDSINRVVDYSLSHHLTKSKSDLPTLYSDSMRFMVAMTPDANQREDLRRRVLNDDMTADSARLSDCSDILAVQEAWARTSPYSGNSMTYGQAQDLAQRVPELKAALVNKDFLSAQSAIARTDINSMAYHVFLSVFAFNLDVFSGYSPVDMDTSASNVGPYSFGVTVDLAAEVELGRTKIERDTVMVEAVQDEKSPLRRGDRITKIGTSSYDMKSVRGQDPDLVEAIFVSARLPVLYVEFKRTEAGKEITKSESLIGTRVSDLLTKAPSVAGELRDNIIFVKIFGFHDGSDILLANKISELREDWLKSQLAAGNKDANTDTDLGIILDLRYNGGGAVDEAQRIIGLFLPQSAIGTMRERSNYSLISTESYSASTRAAAIKNPLAILVNNGSASASEMTTQSLKAKGRALVIGDRTYGKGIGQSTIPLLVSGVVQGMLKLTQFYFNGPDGENIQLTSILPHISFAEMAISGLKLVNASAAAWASELKSTCDSKTSSSEFDGHCIQRMEDLKRFPATKSRYIENGGRDTCANCRTAENPLAEKAKVYAAKLATTRSADYSKAASTALGSDGGPFENDATVLFASDILKEYIAETTPPKKPAAAPAATPEKPEEPGKKK